MDEIDPEAIHKELASLEAAETTISAERRHLHNQIDYGYASEDTRARERDVSDERRQLHVRIDALRALLRGHDPVAAGESEPESGALSQWSGISPEAAAHDGHSAEEVDM